MRSSSSKTVKIPYSEAYAPGFEDMERRAPDIDKISTLLGWEPRITFDETIDAVTTCLGGVPILSRSQHRNVCS